jgi:hypothetical protein
VPSPALLSRKAMAAQSVAGQSALRERSPEQFRAHVQAVVDQGEGTNKSIHVDGEVLNQLPDEVRALLPQAVQDQIAEAAASGNSVEIPMADVLTVAPGTPLEQVLNEHARIRYGWPGSASTAGESLSQPCRPWTGSPPFPPPRSNRPTLQRLPRSPRLSFSTCAC